MALVKRLDMTLNIVNGCTQELSGIDNIDYNSMYSCKRRCDSISKNRIGPSFVTTKDNLEHADKTKPGKLRIPEHKSNDIGIKLLIYLWGFTNNQEISSLDLNYMKRMLDNGVDINTKDELGQTVLHAIIRDWNIDVARFFIKHKANVNAQDIFGRSPLHLAAALNYVDVTKVLIENGANPNLTTFHELQTPVHYASKYNSLDVLRFLIKKQGSISIRDSINRTPLFLAAEKGCNNTADFLIEIGIPSAVFDIYGNSALAFLVENIPSVAFQALGQYIEHRNSTSHCYLYLSSLEVTKKGSLEETFAKSTLDNVISYSDVDLIMHPVIQSSIAVKWKMFGRNDTIRKLIVTFLYIACWIAAQFMFTNTHKENKNQSNILKAYGWEILLEILIIIFALYFVIKDYVHVKASIEHHRKWISWRLKQVRSQYVYCHPAWPSEREKLCNEEEMISSSQSMVRKHLFWFIYECLNIVILIAVIVSQILYLLNNSSLPVYVAHHILFSLNMGCAFVRVIKICLRFQYFAVFLKVASLASTSFVQIVFLYIQFYIPFVAAFWLFIEEAPINIKDHAVNSSVRTDINISTVDLKVEEKEFLNSLSRYFYYVYITSFEQEELRKLAVVDKTGATILLSLFDCFTTFLALSIIIAFITGKFASNIQKCIAEASLLRSSIVLQLERKLSKKNKSKLANYYISYCSPLLVNNQSLPKEIHGRNAERKLKTLDHQLEGISEKLRSAENNSKENKGNDKSLAAKGLYNSTFKQCINLHKDHVKYRKLVRQQVNNLTERAEFVREILPRLINQNLKKNDS